MADASTLDGPELHAAIWRELARAVTDRDHPWRTPVVATVDASGRPAARTVVLRDVDAQSGILVFYTDARSPKAAQLGECDAATLVFWSAALGWQLRAACRARVASTGAEVEAVWQCIADTPAATDYLSDSAPGTPLPGVKKDSGRRHHLAVVSLVVQSMDWLALNEQGHRRARIDGDAIAWVVP